MSIINHLLKSQELEDAFRKHINWDKVWERNNSLTHKLCCDQSNTIEKLTQENAKLVGALEQCMKERDRWVNLVANHICVREYIIND